jgi:hypothetical protein
VAILAATRARPRPKTLKLSRRVNHVQTVDCAEAVDLHQLRSAGRRGRPRRRRAVRAAAARPRHDEPVAKPRLVTRPPGPRIPCTGAATAFTYPTRSTSSARASTRRTSTRAGCCSNSGSFPLRLIRGAGSTGSSVGTALQRERVAIPPEDDGLVQIESLDGLLAALGGAVGNGRDNLEIPHGQEQIERQMVRAPRAALTLGR